MAKALDVLRYGIAAGVIMLSTALLDLAGYVCPELKWAYCVGVALGVEKIKQVEK